MQLLKKARRRIRLTTAGRAYLQDARRLLDGLVLAGLRANRFARVMPGILRIGFQQAAARDRTPSRFFREFSTGYNNVHRQLTPMTSQAQVEAFLSRDIDAGFLINRAVDKRELDWLPVSVDAGPSFALRLEAGREFLGEPNRGTNALSNRAARA